MRWKSKFKKQQANTSANQQASSGQNQQTPPPHQSNGDGPIDVNAE